MDSQTVPDMSAAPYFLENAAPGFPPSAGAVPLPCRRPMQPQPVAVWTPIAMLGALVMALLKLPRQALLVPAMLRSRTRRA